jgi:hypothetical protein
MLDYTRENVLKMVFKILDEVNIMNKRIVMKACWAGIFMLALNVDYALTAPTHSSARIRTEETPNLLAVVHRESVDEVVQFIQEGAPQVQYLSAAEIRDFINKYIEERPLEQVKRELGEPSGGPTAIKEEFGFATWYKGKNELSVAMAYNQYTNMVRLISVAEYYADSDLRDRRFVQMTADFERIFAIPPIKKTGQEVVWDASDGRVFSIKMEKFPVSWGLVYYYGL